MSTTNQSNKIGEWLKEKVPKIHDVVKDVLPDSGALGIITRIIDTDPEISASDKLEL